MKKFTKSNDKRINGVCGGIAEFFNTDPSMVRIGYTVLTLMSGFPGIILYIIMSICMPKAPKTIIITSN